MAHLGLLPLRVEFVQTLCIADKLGFLDSIEHVAMELHTQRQKPIKMPYISLPKLRNKLKKSPPPPQESAEQPCNGESLKDDSTVVILETEQSLPLLEHPDDPNSFLEEKNIGVESASETDSLGRLSSTLDGSDTRSQELTVNCTHSPQTSDGVVPATDVGQSGTSGDTAVVQPPGVEEFPSLASRGGCGMGSELGASGGGCGTGSELDASGDGRGMGSKLGASRGGCGTGSELDASGGGCGMGSELDASGGGCGTGSELGASRGGCGTGSELDASGGCGTGSELDASGGGCGTGSELGASRGGCGTGSELDASGGCGTGSELDASGGGCGMGSELDASRGGCGTGSELDASGDGHGTGSKLGASGDGCGTGSKLGASRDGRGTGSKLDAGGDEHDKQRDKKHRRRHPKAAAHGDSKWFGGNKKQPACRTEKRTEKAKVPAILYYGMGAGRFCT